MSVIERWEVEDGLFWKETGSRIAWRTLIITTVGLVLSFATWFMISAIVVRLPGIGFRFSTLQLFWLAAMPGLAGGTFRIVHTFLIPIFGTRKVVTAATWIKLVPCIGLGLAVRNPGTPYWVFLVLAFSAGFGGGDFSSFMPSTNLFFPKRLKGTALGIQAGVGNFGVSLAQFATPWIVGFAAFGAAAGGPQAFAKGGHIWLQNAAFWYVPLLVLVGIAAWIGLRRVPVQASFREQLDIFKNKHTWFCTLTYVMTFGSFAGLSAAFPLMIKELYGRFPNAPDPLTYAFYGPLIGSAARVFFGWVSDKTGGAILTHICGIGLILATVAMIALGLLAPTSLDQFPYFVAVMLGLFLFTGMGNASTFRQYPIVFAHSPRQAAGVLGWTAAVAAYGPFVFSALIGTAIAATKTGTSPGHPTAFFCGIVGLYLAATAVNWWYYLRKGCEKPS